MAVPYEVIDLDNSSNAENMVLDDHLSFNSEEPFEAKPQRYMSNDLAGINDNRVDFTENVQSDLGHHDPGLRPKVQTYERCCIEVTEIFPDISQDHVRQLYDKHVKTLTTNHANQGGLAQLLIEEILDGGRCPKERDRLKALNELKR